jgi:hypothetical protein
MWPDAPATRFRRLHGMTVLVARVNEGKRSESGRSAVIQSSDWTGTKATRSRNGFAGLVIPTAFAEGSQITSNYAALCPHKTHQPYEVWATD